MTTETDMMDYEIIYKFFAKEATPEETDRLEIWLKEDPSHEEEFNKAYELFVLTHMSAGSSLADMSCQDKSPRNKWHRHFLPAQNQLELTERPAGRTEYGAFSHIRLLWRHPLLPEYS